MVVHFGLTLEKNLDQVVTFPSVVAHLVVLPFDFPIDQLSSFHSLFNAAVKNFSIVLSRLEFDLKLLLNSPTNI